MWKVPWKVSLKVSHGVGGGFRALAVLFRRAARYAKPSDDLSVDDEGHTALDGDRAPEFHHAKADAAAFDGVLKGFRRPLEERGGHGFVYRNFRAGVLRVVYSFEI